MANPSPVCTVADGVGSPQATTNGVDVTAAATITIALADAVGVRNWSLTLYGQDELVTAPTVTINQVSKTATFTAPALPWSLIYKSTVNNGIDANGILQDSLSTTFKICCLTTGGARLAASNETTENDADYGWTSIVNEAIRNPSAGTTGVTVQEEGGSLATIGTTLNFVGSSCTATGISSTKTITFTGLFGVNPVQCTSVDRSNAGILEIGAVNATSVEIADAGVDTQILGDFVVDGSTLLDSDVEISGGLEILGNITSNAATETWTVGDTTLLTAPFALDTTDATQATAQTILTVPASRSVKIHVTLTAYSATNAASWDISFTVYRFAAGSAAIATTAPSNVAGDDATAGASTWRATVDLSGNDVRIRVTGEAATNIAWRGFSQYLQATP